MNHFYFQLGFCFVLFWFDCQADHIFAQRIVWQTENLKKRTAIETEYWIFR